jgi:hypothetical protein
MNNAETFVERFRAFGAEPCPDRYEDLFDPDDGTVMHPGMMTPLPRNQVKTYMVTYLSTVPDFRFEIVSWAECNGTVFIEAQNQGRPGGTPIEWGSVYRIVLRGDRVLRGQAFADRIPILAEVLPDATLRAMADLGAPGPSLALENAGATAP